MKIYLNHVKSVNQNPLEDLQVVSLSSFLPWPLIKREIASVLDFVHFPLFTVPTPRLEGRGLCRLVRVFSANGVHLANKAEVPNCHLIEISNELIFIKECWFLYQSARDRQIENIRYKRLVAQ